MASFNAFANERQPVIAVVVDGKENVAELKFTSNELRLFYWRKQLFWPMGRRIKPVNLTAEHSLRLQFSQIVLGSTPKKQIDYWNGLYFDGISPPYSVNSEEAVLRYVSQTDGAIGYLNACKIDHRVKPLAWIINNQISMSEPATNNCDK
jgi:hypothetical protein